MASTHDTAIKALRTALAGITAGVNGAVYTPDTVRLLHLFPEDLSLDLGYTTVYLLRPSNEPRNVTIQGCYCEGETEAVLLLATKSNTQPDDPTRREAASDLVADAMGKILADRTLGGTAVDVFGFAVDYERHLDVWACAELRLVIRWRYTITASGR